MDKEPGPPLVAEMQRATKYLRRPDVNLPDGAIALILPTVVRSTRSRMEAIVEAMKKFDPGPEVEWAAVPALPDGTPHPGFLDHFPGLSDFLSSQLPKECPCQR